MSNRLKRLQAKLKSVREDADYIAGVINITEDIDALIDLKADLARLEEQEHKLEVSIEAEKDSISTEE
jgi:predicted  nucleic acid-binding Zn-ribbon protein